MPEKPISEPLLTVENLSVAFAGKERTVEAVKNVSLTIARGETLALVGESGSGKSVTALSTVSLLPDTAQITGSVKYAGAEMIGASRRELMRVRGNDISFIFQEPMTSLNPLHTIEKQLAESLALHQGVARKDARGRIIELLNQVGLRDPEERLGAWPHQLSGGQRQRVMIAARPADRRRADHGAGRYYPGADPGAAGRFAARTGPVDAVHHP
jgi:microcin C transport system ATP-binding protein